MVTLSSGSSYTRRVVALAGARRLGAEVLRDYDGVEHVRVPEWVHVLASNVRTDPPRAARVLRFAAEDYGFRAMALTLVALSPGPYLRTLEGWMAQIQAEAR